MTDSHAISFGFTAGRFPAGLHIAYVFNDDDERRATLTRFIQSGLAEGDFVECLTDTTAEELIGELANAGSSSTLAGGKRQLVIARSGDAHCPDHAFVAERTLERVRSGYTRAIRDGFLGARTAADMSWALSHPRGAERLIEYEAWLNLALHTHPTTLICQYDARKFDGATLFDVLNVHPMIVVHGRIAKNPFYVPPGEYLADRAVYAESDALAI